VKKLHPESVDLFVSLSSSSLLPEFSFTWTISCARFTSNSPLLALH
jgi:hypothetical protein